MRASLSGSLLFLVIAAAMPPAEAASYRLTEPDGTTHFTNAPNDPRYQRLPGGSGTAAGWLRLPGVLAGGVPARYAEDIREIASRYGLAPGLIEAVIRVESGFNPGAVSSKGAQGLMQLMPATASSLGVRNAFDARQNIEGGVRHLRYLVERYAGNLPLALAAYNAGEGAVERHRGIPPYAETQAYVSRILALHGGGARGQVIYRYEDRDGTVTYTNVPPSTRLRLR